MNAFILGCWLSLLLFSGLGLLAIHWAEKDRQRLGEFRRAATELVSLEAAIRSLGPTDRAALAAVVKRLSIDGVS